MDLKKCLTGYGILLIAVASLMTACGGGSSGGSSAPVTSHQVTLSWNANHEKGVNGPGGGYKVAISGKTPIDVPYNAASGVTPTSTMVTLTTGSYTATVSAYAALDANGGTTGSTSASSSSISITVP